MANRDRRLKRFAATATLIAALSGCGSGSEGIGDLRDIDPAAAEACDALSESRTAADSGDALALHFLAGKRAAAADTPEFKSLATPLFDAEALAALEGTDSEGTQAWLLDDDQLAIRCREAGVEVPAGRPPAT